MLVLANCVYTGALARNIFTTRQASSANGQDTILLSGKILSRCTLVTRSYRVCVGRTSHANRVVIGVSITERCMSMQHAARRNLFPFPGPRFLQYSLCSWPRTRLYLLFPILDTPRRPTGWRGPDTIHSGVLSLSNTGTPVSPRPPSGNANSRATNAAQAHGTGVAASPIPLLPGPVSTRQDGQTLIICVTPRRLPGVLGHCSNIARRMHLFLARG